MRVEYIPAVQIVPWFKQLYLAVEGTLTTAWLFAFHSVPFNLIFSAFAVTPNSGVFFTLFFTHHTVPKKEKTCSDRINGSERRKGPVNSLPNTVNRVR